MNSRIPTIPPLTAPANLVATINDRLRKTSTAIAEVSTAVQTIQDGAVNQIPLVQALPKAGSPYARDGVVVDFQGALYRWNAATGIAEPMGGFLVGTHAARVMLDPTKLSAGTPYFEQDRGVTYIVAYDGGSAQNQWRYQSGVYRDVLAVMSSGGSLTALTLYDKGYRFDASDVVHAFEWDGFLWHFEPGDDSGYVVLGTATPPPNGLWYAANGSSYNVVQPNGSLAVVVSPVTAGIYTWLRG
jgi:hypothetical protein